MRFHGRLIKIKQYIFEGNRYLLHREESTWTKGNARYLGLLVTRQNTNSTTSCLYLLLWVWDAQYWSTTYSVHLDHIFAA